MKQDVIFRYKNGRIIPIKVDSSKTTNQFMNDKIRNVDKQEQYFNENFNIEESTYDENDYTKFNEIKVIDKITNEKVGFIKYSDIYDINKSPFIDKDKIYVRYVYVEPKYRNKGIATQMYKQLQLKTNGEDIRFGELTLEGKKLIKKIGKITKEKKYGGITNYWGRINL